MTSRELGRLELRLLRALELGTFYRGSLLAMLDDYSEAELELALGRLRADGYAAPALELGPSAWRSLPAGRELLRRRRAAGQ